MGKTYSAPLPEPTSTCPYFVMVLRPPKALVLIFATDEVQDFISDRLARSWSAGLKNGGSHGRRMADGSIEYLLKGKPFSNTIDARRKSELGLLVCRLLIDLKSIGWRLIASSKDFSQPTPNSSCSTLFFRKVTNVDLLDSELASSEEIICVCSGGAGDPSNRIRVINASTKAISEMAALIEPPGSCKLIAGSDQSIDENVCTLEMDESTWAEGESISSRRFLIKLFHHLHQLGYRFRTALSLDGTSDAAFFERSHSSSSSATNLAPLPSIHDTAEAILEEDEDQSEREEEDEKRTKSEPDATTLEGDIDEEDAENRGRAFSASYRPPPPPKPPRRSDSEESSSSGSSESSSSPGIHFFVMDVSKSTNRLRLVRVPLRILFLIRSLITLRWPYGMRSVSRLDVDAYEFVLGIDSSTSTTTTAASATSTTSSGGGASSTMFVCKLIHTLKLQGWNLTASLDLSHQSDRWTLIFTDAPVDEMGHRRVGPQNSLDRSPRHEPSTSSSSPIRRPSSTHSTTSTTTMPTGRVWSLCMSGPSTLTVVNAHPELRNAICELITRYWPRGIKNVVEFGGNRRIRLVGQPWTPSVHSESVEFRDNEDLLARSLVCILLSSLIETFESRPLCSAGSMPWKTGGGGGSVGNQSLSDAHCSWFFLDPHSDEPDEEGPTSVDSEARAEWERGSKRRSTIC